MRLGNLTHAPHLRVPVTTTLNNSNTKRVAFVTFGCRLNQYDTETLRTLLEDDGGWRTVSAKDEADMYVVNTCSVTSRADATARKAIRRLHNEHPHARIVVTGCYAQRAPEEISELEGVSLIVGAADRARIANAVSEIEDGELRVAVSPISTAKTFLDVPITEMMEHSRAFVKVQEGCNESCTFCIVPQTRGASRSRTPQSVLTQAAALVDKGYTELVVTGVHVGDYGLDLPGAQRLLPDLVRGLLKIPGLQRFRLSSIEPSTVTDELIQLARDEEKFARHFHIPFQSGSNAVLERMKRRYTVQQFAATLSKIVEGIPECGIGTDVICGFPGETDADFQQTFDQLSTLPITYLHPFTYSVRPGSEAEAFGDHVSGDVKKRRTRALKRLMDDKNRAFRQRHVGQSLPVLLEPGRRDAQTHAAGYTDNYIRVEIDNGRVTEGLHNVRLVELTGSGVRGELIN